MAAELAFAPEAERDLDEAYTWYEGQRGGLGEEFLRCVDACIQSILRQPESLPTIFQSYRRSLVRRFPYAVFYEYGDNTVIVYCVLHTKRDPESRRTRLS